MSVEEFLKHQAAQYKKHQQTINTTKATLNHQYQLQTRGTIPKKHRPKPPTIISTDHSQTQATESFLSEYNKLFFRSLQEAISQNSITLELEKARCVDILNQTEKELCRAAEPPAMLLKWYTSFLRQINCTDHEMSLELQHKFRSPDAHHTQDISQSKKRPPQSKGKYPINRSNTTTKRKTLVAHPPAKKQMKIDHFLEKGRITSPNPT